MRAARCCALLVLLAAAVIAEPIVLRATRHVNAHAPARRARDGEPETYSENIVSDLETYAIEVNLGTPSKTYRVVVDTASADLFVYSNACPKTACPGPTLSTSASTSNVKCGAPLTCKSCGASDSACLFSQTYGDGATCSGRVVKEKINFGDKLVADAYVGLVDAATGGPGKPAFFTNASLSGIFGVLPTAATSNFGGQSPLFALMSDNKLPSGMTLCLRPDGGSLILGESFDHTRTNYQWSKLTSRSLYTVKLNDVAMPRKGFEGGLLSIADGAAILDSATTNIVLPAAHEAKFKAALKALCSKTRAMKGICDATPSIWTNFVQLTETDLAAFPNIVFYIDGLDSALALLPAMYMTSFNGYYTMNIDFYGTKTILGNGFMKNFRIGIDLVTRQIGFGNVMTCPGGAIPPMATDEETYRIVVNTSFTGFTFPNSKGLRYASMCGGVAPATHCDVGDVLCGKSGATKPRWDRECDDKSIFGRGFETEARFGKPMNRSAEFPAIIATRDIVMPASLPIDKPFVFATIKYFNPRLEAGSAPSQVTLRTTVDFTTPHGVDTYAAFSFDVTLNITHYGRCRGNGCPWNDPKSWPNKLHNAKCKDGALADGTPCCPYWSNRNVHNHCASLVQLGSVYDPNMRAAELDGQLYKIFFIGFHEDSKEHLNDRRLYEFFTADVNAVSQANLHARLIPMCPACPPGTKQTVFEDGSCTCQCETSCELPLVGEPDCSCIERISHDAVCNYFCDANDYASVPCVGGTLYVTDGHYMGLTLPPSPPCTWENYDPYRGYYGEDSGCRQYNDLYCQCVCGTSCPPGTFQNADCTCACSACPDNKMATDGCGCVCRESCHPAMVQDPNTCGCSCPAGCPAGQVQAADCSCYCPAGCPEGLVQRPDCSCGCPAACEAGKVQQGDCSCACPTACPAHKIEVAGCGCDCPAACANGQVQDPNTCACACAAGCPAGQIQQGDCSCTCPHQCGAGLTQAADCSCACATACPAGMVQNADNCQCSCATACPAGQVQDPTTCACGCAAACPGNKIADASCACRCATVCPAGQTQDPSTCLCACDNECPAGQVQDAACGCACPSQCSAPHVQNADCSCSCPATDCGIKTLDPTTCHCSCSNVCVAPKLRLNTETCECQCPSACPAGQVQDPTTCGCSCPNVCPSGKVLVAETCACEDSCKLSCAAPKSLNYDECRCECAAGCPAGKVQDPATCACMCPQSCPTAKAQDAATCACSCPFTCAAGQTQNPDTCECSCADECPAGKARNADNCGCHCATACTGARSDQDPSTCECSCPSDCPAGQIQNLQTCECACPAACPAGQVRDSTGCGCHCAVKCPAGRIQDPTTCECGCAATCHAGQVQADNCQCSCPNFCREGRVQDQDCDCHCAVACSGAKSAQDPDSCECSCPNACPAGQTQNPDTCECSCPNACPTGQVRNANDCGCHCATSCIGAASAQDPDTCTCSCPNECPAGQAQHPLLCTCGCPNRCPAGQEHNADNCGCHCADACEEPKTVQDVTSCECMCPHVECPAGYVADDVHCGCKCAAECGEGHVLNAETCECECATACPPGLVQDKKSCECHCREKDCPAGQVQDPSTCACSCTEQCPAGQLRNTDDCGCHCANACTGAKSAQSADTCECSCPNVCNVPFVQDAASCACTCPSTCAAPLTLNAATCTCGCAEACPAGKVQSRDTCACECPNACPEDADLDDACVCVARRTASKKSNTAAIAGGVAGGVAALAVVAAAVAYLVRRNTAPGDHYRALSSDDQLAGSVTNPAFADSGLTVANPAFGVE